jgi:hypothetical protein
MTLITHATVKRTAKLHIQNASVINPLGALYTSDFMSNFNCDFMCNSMADAILCPNRNHNRLHVLCDFICDFGYNYFKFEQATVKRA